MMSSTSSPETPSLRERRKSETWTAIHDAAAELALQHGTDGASVEQIAAEAGVSTRTFFNYFGTKDEAILGIRDPHVPDRVLEEFDAAGDLLSQTCHLLLTTVRTGRPGQDLPRQKRLLRAEPKLLWLQVDLIESSQRLVVEALTQRLADHPGLSSLGTSTDGAIRLLVTIAAGLLRYAASDPAYDPARGLSPQDIDHALSLYHHLEDTLS